MSTSSWLWVGVRFLGLYFVAKAAMAVPPIVVGVLAPPVTSLAEMPESSASIAGIESAVRRHYRNEVGQSVAQLLVCGIAGAYLIARGKVFHSILLPPAPTPDGWGCSARTIPDQ